MRWNPDDLGEAGRLVGWLTDGGVEFYRPLGSGTTLAIRTLEGEMVAQPGDWIIRGVQGEFYPIKDSIFRETYDLVPIVADDHA